MVPRKNLAHESRNGSKSYSAESISALFRTAQSQYLLCSIPPRVKLRSDFQLHRFKLCSVQYPTATSSALFRTARRQSHLGSDLRQVKIRSAPDCANSNSVVLSDSAVSSSALNQAGENQTPRRPVQHRVNISKVLERMSVSLISNSA